MQEEVTIKIDGRDLTVERGLTILETCRQAGIEIPTLCFNDALEPYAACRLCTVELWVRGGRRFVASCVYPVEEGTEIRTSTEDILRHRKLLVELYLARSPNAKKIRELAMGLGVEESRYKFQETHNCIVCGMCIRACYEIVGAGAIGFSQRGMKRKVEPPFGRGSAACISCGTCTTICPTEAIAIKEIDQVRSVHVAGGGESSGPCSVCAAFEVVPALPKDYVGWLSEKLSGRPAK